MESKIKGIIFDFFGVLSAGVVDEWFPKYTPHLSKEEYQEKYLNPFDAGDMSANDMWEKLASISGKTGPEIANEWVALARIDWAMIARLQEFETKYRVAVCTNVGGDFLNAVLVANDLRDAFKTLVISSEVRLVKPGAEIYRLVLQKLELASEEAVFIDDREINVRGAEAVGMHGIHFTSLAQLNSELSKLGIS